MLILMQSCLKDADKDHDMSISWDEFLASVRKNL